MKEKIYIDEIINESIKSKIEEDFRDYMLYDFFYEKDDDINEEYINISDLVKQYFEGKSEKEFYFYDQSIMPRQEKLPDLSQGYEFWYERIQKQLNSSFKSKNNQFKGRLIPKKDLNNVLLELKYYNHPFKKKLRNKNFENIKLVEIANYIENINKEEVKINDYILEKKYKFELYKNICKTIQEINDTISYNLLKLQYIEDPVKRLKYIELYKEYFNKSNDKWTSEITNIMENQENIYDKVQKEIFYKKICNNKGYEKDIKNKKLLDSINENFSYKNYAIEIDDLKEIENYFKVIMKNEKKIHEEHSYMFADKNQMQRNIDEIIEKLIEI